jgi:hypothetical protein
MRFSSAVAALVLLMSPAALAQSPSSDWSGETTITVTTSLSTTLTVTKTLTYANATTSHSYKPTGWNATSSSTKATTVNKPTLTAASITYYSASPSIASVTATGAADSQEINLAVAAMAGAAALIWGSL